ncbi:MAG: protein kinase, partial [Burkholderiaceae bacterium]
MFSQVESDLGFKPGDSVNEWRITECLHLSRRSCVLRAVDAEGGRAVLKILRQPTPGVQELARFRHEFELARRFEHPHILRPTQMQSFAGRPYLVLPDLPARALREHLRQGVLDSQTVLRIALALVDALQAIHARRVVHRDISPGNILLSGPDCEVLSLIDFGLAAEISTERPLLLRADVLEGSLATLAPEQTGRMSRDVDYRADFYSLGATLFEALTGEPVFAFNDAAQAVHAHLAVPAPLATTRRAGIFAPLAQVLRHCLHKEPEARYQSHAAFRQDLALCLKSLREGRELPDFRPGQADRLGRFQISGRLYGREAMLGQLAEAFDRAAQGDCGLVAIAGFSGIGKTALVQAAHRSLLAQRGSFAAAKFNQFGQDRPYGA